MAHSLRNGPKKWPFPRNDSNQWPILSRMGQKMDCSAQWIRSMAYFQKNGPKKWVEWLCGGIHVGVLRLFECFGWLFVIKGISKPWFSLRKNQNALAKGASPPLDPPNQRQGFSLCRSNPPGKLLAQHQARSPRGNRHSTSSQCLGATPPSARRARRRGTGVDALGLSSPRATLRFGCRSRRWIACALMPSLQASGQARLPGVPSRAGSSSPATVRLPTPSADRCTL